MDAALWDNNKEFYINIKNGYFRCGIRELIGYIPWYFNEPDEDKSVAWKFLNDKDYFFAPYGPTTCEQNSEEYMRFFTHMCLWNGPSWPFATSQTITALGNLLANYNQDVMKKTDYYNLLKLYANSQYQINEKGEKEPYVDENLNPYTGEWLARKIMIDRNFDELNKTRGRHYNYSSYCDLVISGLAGLRARDDDKIEVDPLFEANDLYYFCADGILYHGKLITVLWDKKGKKYLKGKGLKIYVDGKLEAESDEIKKIIL